MKNKFKSLLIVATVAIGINLFNTSIAQAQDSKGTNFWLAFSKNANGTSASLTLFIAGDSATSGMITIPGQGFSTNFSVTPGSITSISIPSSAFVTTDDGVEDRGIHVTAKKEITIYGLNQQTATTDAFLGLPVDVLGQSYFLMSYTNLSFSGTIYASLLTVVGVEENTTVTIMPAVTTNGHTAGVSFNVTLDSGEVYQLAADGTGEDMTGSKITSDKPVAVFGNHSCAYIPPDKSACDHLTEQLPPITTWGKQFVTFPLAHTVNGDIFRYLASENNTTVKVNGVTVATLNAGEFLEDTLTSASIITADKPILVAQYSPGQSFNSGLNSDPFMMLIPPYEQFLGNYTLSTPASGFSSNTINIVAPNSAVGSILLDGSAIPAASFSAIGASGYSGTQQSVSVGTHNLSGPLPFGVFSYGNANFDSYGYPGGAGVAQIAVVNRLTAAPKNDTNTVGDTHCVKVTVKDNNNNPVQGTRIDFLVKGPNAHAGFVNTNSNGEATYCYVGQNIGEDTIIASLGNLVDTVYKSWVVKKDTEVCEAGRIFTHGEATSVKVCLDTVPDWVWFFNSNICQHKYAYIITDNNGNILKVIDADSFDFNNAGAGICRVYGVCYYDTLAYQTGWPVSQLYGDTCWDITDNYLTIYRDTLCDSGCANGKALCLDGDNDYVRVPADPSLDVMDDFTFEGWVCASEKRYWQTIFEFNDSATCDIGVHFYLRAKGNFTKLYANLVDINYKSHAYETKDTVYWIDSCIHVALSRCGNKVKFYVNGVLYQAINVSGGPIGNKKLATSNDLFFGTRPENNLSFEFKGSFDDFRLWNYSRSQAQINHDKDYEMNGSEPGLAGYWNFNNPDPNTAYDNSPNDNDGHIVAAQKCNKCCGPRFDPQPLPQKVLCLDGNDDYVYIPADCALDVKNNFTIEAWGQPGDKLYWQALVEYNNGGNGQGVHLYFRWRNNGAVRTIHANLVDKSGKSHWYRTPVNLKVWTPGQCYHIALTRCADTVFIYVNGVKYSTDNYLGGPIGTKMVETSHDLYFGARIKNNTPIFDLNGYIDEVRIWNYCRTQTEIQNNMNKELNGTQPGLVGFWNFNNPSTTTAYDLSGNGNNGKLIDNATKTQGFHCPGQAAKKTFFAAENGEPLIGENEVFLNNYPNPFSNTTTITYTISEEAQISIIVYDINGKVAKNLVNGLRAEGSYTLNWNGTGLNGDLLQNGIYIIRMVTKSKIITKSVMLQR